MNKEIGCPEKTLMKIFFTLLVAALIFIIAPSNFWKQFDARLKSEATQIKRELTGARTGYDADERKLLF